MIAVSKIKITIKNYKVMTKNGAQSRQIPMKEIVLIEVVGLQVTTFLNVHCLTGIFQGFFFIFRNTSSTRHSQWLLAYFISIFHFSTFLTTARILNISKFTETKLRMRSIFYSANTLAPSILAQPTITCSNSTIEAPEQDVKYVQS